MILQGFSGFLFFTGYKMATSAEFFVAIIFCRYGIKLERLVWELEKSETELRQILPGPILEKVAALLSEEISERNGTPTELVEALQLEAKPNLLTKHLNVNASRLLHECHSQYENIRTHAGRKIVLKRVSEQRDDA